MQRINTFALYTLGKKIGPIEALSEEGATYGALRWPLFFARMEVRTLLENGVLPLRTTRQAATRLLEAIDQIVPSDIQEALKTEEAAEINWWLVRQVKDAAAKFETVFAEELAILDTYSVSQKGAYSTAELISNAEVMFSKAVREKLPAQAVEDIHEAGKCLAFETATAAAFHIVRAIESVILAYYEKVLERKPPNRMRNWGVYIKTLEESGKADQKILDFLKHIKDNYRNPVSHPNAAFSVEEAVVLLGVAVGAITQMALSL